MKFTLSWLKEHLDTKASVAEIADTLTRIGLEVEEVFDRRRRCAISVWPKWSNARNIRTPTKLSVCEVDTGSERLQVGVRRAERSRGPQGRVRAGRQLCAGIDLTLTRAKIRGVESNGMLLSERELELSDEHTGIIELAPDAKDRQPAAKALGSRRRGDRDRHHAQPARLSRPCAAARATSPLPDSAS